MKTIEDNILGVSGNYRYKVLDTGRSGYCQICKQPIETIIFQMEEMKWDCEEWVNYSCRHWYGHEECIKTKRR